MSERNEHFENFVLFLLIGGLVIAGVLFVLFSFWPYFVFYVLPLVIGSVVVGGILRIATLPAEGSGGMVSYKPLAIAYPVMIGIVAFAFFANSQRSTAIDKKGNITGVFLDWPELNKTFNEYRASTYANSPFDSLKAKAKEGAVYDRQEAGWIALWCLILGGPAFFWYLARSDEESNREVIESMALERTKRERERVQEKERNVNEIIARGLNDAKDRVAKAEREKAAVMEENQVLKAKVEFSKDVPKPPEVQKSSGVLDKDIL